MPTTAATPEDAKQLVQDTYRPQWQAATTAAQKLAVLRTMQVEVNGAEVELSSLQDKVAIEMAHHQELRRLIKLGLTNLLE